MHRHFNILNALVGSSLGVVLALVLMMVGDV